MTAKRKHKKHSTRKKSKSNSIVIWTIIIVSLIIIGYFTYPQIKPWFVEEVSSKETQINKKSKAEKPHQITANVWVNEMDGSMLSFKSDDSFSIDFPAVDQSRQITGSYRLQDKSITIKYSSNVKECSGKEGSYTYTLKEDALNFSDINDSCEDRKDLLTSGWFAL